ncbi:MAG: hypothetical protein CM1200mP30_03570 [Pseudomonadota bacterium]|nr:MAG: hypothetical protein CM1200mP30_03570 [Pseudomonadota bacterium]
MTLEGTNHCPCLLGKSHVLNLEPEDLGFLLQWETAAIAQVPFVERLDSWKKNEKVFKGF